MPGDNIPWEGISDFTLFGEKKRVLDCERVDFESAVKLQSDESYIDASSPFWEELRYAIQAGAKKNLWDDIFNRAKGYAKTAYEKSVAAQKLEKRLDVGETVFIADLPCIGAAFERLAYEDWGERFFNRALTIYNSGYWICGYNDEKFIICGEYE